MNPSQPHSAASPALSVSLGRPRLPSLSPSGFLGALLSGAIIRVLQWRRAEEAARPIQGTPARLVLRSCWVVRAGGAGPGLGGWREAELGVGAPGPCRLEAGRVPRWLGLPRLADQHRCRPQAPTQPQIWVPPTQGPETPSLSSSVATVKGCCSARSTQGWTWWGAGGPPEASVCPPRLSPPAGNRTAPAGRRPPGSPADSPGPRVLPGCSDACHMARGADPHNLSAFGLGEERRQEVRGRGGLGLQLGDGSCKARSSSVPRGAPESGSRLHMAERGPLPTPPPLRPLTPLPPLGDRMFSPLPSP